MGQPARTVAPKLAIGMTKHKQLSVGAPLPVASRAGFTLIELLIVIFIISIVTAVALLRIGQNDRRQVADFAEALTQRITLAQEQALLQPVIIGIRFEPHAYRFLRLLPQQPDAPQQKKNAPRWQSLGDDLLDTYPIPATIDMQIKVAGDKELATDSATREKIKRPQVIISTNGDITPFRITIARHGGKPQYVIIGESDGNVAKQSH